MANHLVALSFKRILPISIEKRTLCYNTSDKFFTLEEASVLAGLQFLKVVVCTSFFAFCPSFFPWGASMYSPGICCACSAPASRMGSSCASWFPAVAQAPMSLGKSLPSPVNWGLSVPPDPSQLGRWAESPVEKQWKRCSASGAGCTEQGEATPLSASLHLHQRLCLFQSGRLWDVIFHAL